MYFGRRDECTPGVGDAVNTAMNVVPVGVTLVVLGMANERVVPVGYIEGSIGGKLQINRAEVGVGRAEQILARSSRRSTSRQHRPR